MSVITRMLKQNGVYWAPAAPDDFGTPTHAAPVAITVRWEDVTEEFVDIEGETQLSKAKVFVSQDVEVKGMLYLGDLADVGSSGLPSTVTTAWEIRRFEKLPNFKATEFLRTAIL